MKQKLNNLQKLSTLLFVALMLLFTCDKDAEILLPDTQQTNTALISEVVSFDMIPKNIVESVEHLKYGKNTYQSKVNNPLDIDWEKILKLQDSPDNIKYSIRFRIKGDPEHIFYNIVLGSSHKNILAPFILKYTLGNFNEMIVDNQLNFSNFKGQIDLYDYHNFINTLDAIRKNQNYKNKDTKFSNRFSQSPCSTNTFKGSNGNGGDNDTNNTFDTSGNNNTNLLPPIHNNNITWQPCKFSIIGIVNLYGSLGTTWTLHINCGGGNVDNNTSEYNNYTKSTTNNNCIKPDGYIPINKIDPEFCERDKGYVYDPNLHTCVKVDAQIINQLTGKAKCIYDKLKSSSTGFKNAIKKFDGEFPVSHIKFEIDPNMSSNTKRAYTRAPENYVIDIVLNGNSTKDASYQKRPNLLVAKTIIHEVIHAEMFRKLLSLANSNGSINVSLVNQMLQQGDYPGMLDYYFRNGEDINSNWQHQQMATHYRETIGRALQEFDTGTSVPDNQQPSQLYMDLAWEGLNHSSLIAWQEAISQTERNRINQVIENYINQHPNQNCTE